jgi:hypothetical protein
MKAPMFNSQSSILNCLALALWLALAPAEAATVVGTLANSTNGLAAVRKALLTPLSTPAAQSNFVQLSDRLMLTLGTNGSFTLTNLAAGGYRLEVQGPPATTPIEFDVPATNAVLNLTGLIRPTTYSAGSSRAYTQAETDALLAALALTGGTNSGTSVFVLDGDGDLTPGTTTGSDLTWQTDLNGDLTPK